MTIVGAFLRRRFPNLPPTVPRFFQVDHDTQMRGDCHWQSNPAKHPTLVIVHGLEGSSDSGYMLGTAEKAYIAGLNVVRLNQRNCGGTEKLTPTLYHSGRSADVRAVVEELIERDQLPEIFVAGYSMGGNLVLKMAGEFGDAAPRQLRGIVAVAPALDLAACCAALNETQNFIYNRHFVRELKRRMLRKAELFPQIYAENGMALNLARVHSVRDFDELITAPFCGFKGADDYYARSSAMHALKKIRVPTLILTAQDDPVVPYRTFDRAELRENPNIELIAPQYGGHGGFVSRVGGAERFWAEARIVEFCVEQSATKDQSRKRDSSTA